jgi:glutamyl-tRNA reductase
MSLLVVGLSHKSAPLTLLERTAVAGDALRKLLHDVHQSQHTAGTFVVSTCNRVEVYADVEKFHAGVSAVSELLARHADVDLVQLTKHLYVHYEERAVHHLFAVACGLDSMVTGESQILGQVRQALKYAEEQGTLGRLLADLGRLALHAGKRAHSETGIDLAGASMVSVGIGLAVGKLRSLGTLGTHGQPILRGQPESPGRAEPEDRPAADGSAEPFRSQEPACSLEGVRTLVVGAGSMSALAATTAARAGATHIVVANRTASHAQRLASSVHGETAALAELTHQIAVADLVISCTGAPGLVITSEMARDALAARAAAGNSAGDPKNPTSHPVVFIDLALPRDVDPAVASMPGATVIGLAEIGTASRDGAGSGRGGAHNVSHDADIAAARRIVADEVAAHASAVHAARVTPTVVALRAKAAKVVDAELARLGGRLAGVDGHDLEEIARAMRRVVDKLLHAPTVRVKELAGSPGGDSYAAALRELFDLDPKAVEAVTRADADLGSGQSDPSRLSDPARQSDPSRQSDPARQSDPSRQSDPARLSDPARQSDPSRMDELSRPSGGTA